MPWPKVNGTVAHVVLISAVPYTAFNTFCNIQPEKGSNMAGASHSVMAKVAVAGSKASVLTQSVVQAAVGAGIVIGIAAYHLACKYWLNKKEDDSES